MRYATIILLLLLIACSKKATTITTIIKDSTIVKEIVRYDTISIKGDTVTLVEKIECDSITNKPKPFKLHSRSGRASVNVSINNLGELKVNAVCDSLQKIVEIKDKEITRLRSEVTKSEIVKQPSKLKIWFDVTCKILAGLFLLLLGVMVFKHYI